MAESLRKALDRLAELRGYRPVAQVLQAPKPQPARKIIPMRRWWIEKE